LQAIENKQEQDKQETTHGSESGHEFRVLNQVNRVV